MREYFCAYHSMLGGTRKLSDAECGRLFRALLRYSSGEDVELINLQGREEVLFDVYSQQIDRDIAAYEGKCATNKSNAAKRSQANGNDGKRSQANGNDGSQDKDEGKGKGEDDTSVTSLPPSIKKKIDNNYKHSTKARMAVAQLIVDQFTEEALPVTRDYPVLYNDVLCALVEGLTPDQIYSAGKQSRYAGEFNAILLAMNGYKWSTEDPYQDG